SEGNHEHADRVPGGAARGPPQRRVGGGGSCSDAPPLLANATPLARKARRGDGGVLADPRGRHRLVHAAWLVGVAERTLDPCPHGPAFRASTAEGGAVRRAG